MKLHPGPEWRIFHVLTSEDIDDVSGNSSTNSWKKWQTIDLSR